ARVRTILRDGALVLDVGRSQRLVTERQFRALLIRHQGRCAYPGCGNSRGLEAHHIRPWFQGGGTDLMNLILICQAHHLAHHDGEFTITALPGERFRFVRREGQAPPAYADNHVPGNARAIEAEHAEVAPDAATPAWDGQRLDRRYAVAVLAERREADRRRRAALSDPEPPD
ncbi:MAG: HNH endonuclease signature motif containing protein, partial [Trebonia sp.]